MSNPSSAKIVLALGISANILCIAYFKYANFFVDNLNSITGADVRLGSIILPLAISFFTFQQVAYLVDVYRNEARETNFLRYALFVLFFPQLIAGPIVHHKEMMPQFARRILDSARAENITIGVTIFVIGLSKKVLIADTVAEFSTPVFVIAEQGGSIDFYSAWTAALSYTFQIYFDFSGYSDMAVGAARLFGIRLPMNFYSPYRTTSIIDFWRTWHMTLSRFLRDYLYIPIGGGRKGPYRRVLNILVTMLLGGLWHGAGWTFMVWGGLHGVYLIVNHIWRELPFAQIKNTNGFNAALLRQFYRIITFLSVVVAWVFFRAETFDGATRILRGMVAIDGIKIPTGVFRHLPTDLQEKFIELGITSINQSSWPIILLPTLLLVVWMLPNTYEFLRRYQPVIPDARIDFGDNSVLATTWKFTPAWAIVFGVVASICLFAMLSASQEFLYYNF